MDKKTSAPVVKSLARHISETEISQVAGAGTVVKTSQETQTTEDTYNSKGTVYLGKDTITGP